MIWLVALKDLSLIKSKVQMLGVEIIPRSCISFSIYLREIKIYQFSHELVYLQSGSRMERLVLKSEKSYEKREQHPRDS